MKADVDDEVNLGVITRFLWRYRLVVAICALLGALLAGVLAFTTKPYFQAEVVVTDVREHGAAGLGGLASQLGGLASLAGVNLTPGSGGVNSQESAAVLESRHLAEEFITRNSLLPVLLRNSTKPPTVWLAAKRLTQDVVTIRKDLRKGTTTVVMQWTDPAIAARWANAYVALANELIRARALDESNRNIAYLNEQIAKTASVDLRKVMYNLIENETKSLMIANGRAEYAFEVVDPAVAPELKVGPHRLLNTLVGFVLGFTFGSGLAFSVDRVRLLRSARRPAAGAPSLNTVSG